MSAWRFGRRATAALISVVVVVTVAVALVVVHLTRGDDWTTKLVKGGDTYTFCWTSRSDQDWSRLQKSGMEFGLDVLNLAPANGHVTVTKAELIKPKGGLRLITSVFAPFSGFAIGGFGSHFGTPAYIKDYVRPVPATLAPVSPPGAPADFKGGKQWELGVVVNVPPTAADASASGVKLTYRSGATTRTYSTIDTMRITNGNSAKCGSS